MCGIAGILDWRGGARAPRRDQLQAMIGQLRHRGPDGFGFLLQPQVGLAHARLSIIDIAGGDQPIFNEDRTVAVVFNGEIFNYIELRAALEQQGHRFATHSDTEVIVHLYEQYGDAFVDHLNGQFAIALWDQRRERLLLVRDRVGIAPLFFTFDDGRLLFASEVKALLTQLDAAPRLHAAALDQIFTFWAPVATHTLFEGVHSLAPGTLLVAERDAAPRIRRYWDWQFPNAADEYAQGSEDELAATLHELLVDATQVRLRADVPVGAYLSGGLDSSVLTSLIKHHSATPLRTFSIGFADESFDESRYQRLMIDHLQTDHSHMQCTNRDVGEHFVATIRHAETAVLRTAPVPMQLLSGLVRAQGYKVVLTGEGADEVLGGYDIFKEAKIRRFWARQPQSQWRPLLLKRLYPYLDITAGRAQTYLQNFYGIGLDAPDSPFFAHLTRWDTTAKAKVFFSDALQQQLRERAEDTLAATLPSMQRWQPFNRGQYLEAKSLMAEYLLCSQGDRMLMTNAVEGRFPFLDHRVIEFANRLPPRLKMKVLTEKYLLKRAMRRYLPAEIVERHKQPYRAPDIPAFIDAGTNRLLDFAADLLAPEKIRDYGYFDADRVGMLVKKALRGGSIGYRDNQAFVGILATQVWHHEFVANHARFKS